MRWPAAPTTASSRRASHQLHPGAGPLGELFDFVDQPRALRATDFNDFYRHISRELAADYASSLVRHHGPWSAPPRRRSHASAPSASARAQATPRDCRAASLPPRCSARWRTPSVRRPACSARSCLRPGRWRRGSTLRFAASRVADLAAATASSRGCSRLLLARSRGHARPPCASAMTMPPSSEALATCFLDAWPELEPLGLRRGAAHLHRRREDRVRRPRQHGRLRRRAPRRSTRAALTDEVLRLAAGPLAGGGDAVPAASKARAWRWARRCRGGGGGARRAGGGVDSLRIGGLRDAGYRVETSSIPHEITPKNRLILGSPLGARRRRWRCRRRVAPRRSGRVARRRAASRLSGFARWTSRWTGAGRPERGGAARSGAAGRCRRRRWRRRRDWPWKRSSSVWRDERAAHRAQPSRRPAAPPGRRRRARGARQARGCGG